MDTPEVRLRHEQIQKSLGLWLGYILGRKIVKQEEKELKAQKYTDRKQNRETIGKTTINKQVLLQVGKQN